MNFSENILNQIWEKASKVRELDERIYRKDACGALIMRDKYGKINPYGWVVDHIFPISKADDYPSYMTAIIFDGKKNIPLEKGMTVNHKKRQILKEIYPNA